MDSVPETLLCVFMLWLLPLYLLLYLSPVLIVSFRPYSRNERPQEKLSSPQVTPFLPPLLHQLMSPSILHVFPCLLQY